MSWTSELVDAPWESSGESMEPLDISSPMDPFAFQSDRGGYELVQERLPFTHELGALAQNAGDPNAGSSGQGNLNSDVPAPFTLFWPSPTYMLFPDGEGGVYALEYMEAGPSLGRLLRTGKLPRFLRNKFDRVMNQIAAGGMRGIAGAVNTRQALQLGERFVGPGFQIKNNGKVFMSNDGLRQFRLPSAKKGIDPLTGAPYSKTGVQVNFELRAVPSGRWTSNVHLDVAP